MDRSDVVAAINELVSRGLADRSRDPADGRRNVITITRPGPPTSGGWRNCWPKSRTSCSPRSHQPTAGS
jgi:hypothetical protein